MRPTLRENLATLRPIRGLLVSIAVARSSVMLFPFYGAYLAVTREGLRPAAIGLVIGAFGVGALLADVTVSQLTRRMPERRVAVLGMLGVALCVLVVAVVPGLWPLVAATAAWGFCYELINPVSYTMVANTMPDSQRRFAFAAVRLAVNVGMGIGPVIAGLLFKVSPGLLVWGTAVGYLVAAGVLARSRLTDDRREATAPAAADPAGDGPAADRSGSELRFWSFFASIMPIHLAYALPPTVVSAYVIQKLHGPPVWVSAIFATNALMVITCEISLNHLMNHWRRRTTLLTGYACAIIGFGLMGLGANPWLLLLGTAWWTLGEMIVFPAMMDHVSAVSPPALKARNIGFYAAGVNIGVLVAPMMFLPLIAVVDARVAWAVVAGVVGLGMIAVAALSTVRYLWTSDGAAPAAVAEVSR
ncbi:MFS transporter [Micromonospora sp. R77]|uniref:MFS transporter n=1 Tax=Micromonospora sp. R77 TaxID=2925836 RepID=UPI001F6184F3|nr:MFS transporter [Micromonospora sp. R77]MCI4066889.1 MFS transporter [Micromonospora sp. R77]